MKSVKNSSLSIYVKHKIGTILAFGIIAIMAKFFLENREILDTAIGKASFFWSWILYLIPIPLIGGISFKESLKFLAFSITLFFMYGLIASTIPTNLVPRTISILTISLILVFILMKKKKQKIFIFDLQPKINPSLFLESTAAGAISFLCSFILSTFKIIDIKITSVTYINYLILSLIIYIILSTITVISQVFRLQKLSK